MDNYHTICLQIGCNSQLHQKLELFSATIENITINILQFFYNCFHEYIDR